MELVRRAHQRAKEILESLNTPKAKMFLSEADRNQILDTAGLLIALSEELIRLDGGGA